MKQGYLEHRESRRKKGKRNFERILHQSSDSNFLSPSLRASIVETHAQRRRRNNNEQRGV
jgi:hypothetical protein